MFYVYIYFCESCYWMQEIYVDKDRRATVYSCMQRIAKNNELMFIWYLKNCLFWTIYLSFLCYLYSEFYCVFRENVRKYIFRKKYTNFDISGWCIFLIWYIGLYEWFIQNLAISDDTDQKFEYFTWWCRYVMSYDRSYINNHPLLFINFRIHISL